MDKRQLIVTIILVLILFISFSSCRSVHVGGTGKVGEVSGRGEIDIPMPEKK